AMTQTPTPDWQAARAAMHLDPTIANLNTGSFGPLPKVVFDRATELRKRLAEEPMDFFVRRLPPLLWEARRRLAEFVGTDPRRLIFTCNVTTSINIVAGSLQLSGPGEILLTDHEYLAMQWCWERAAQRQGLTVRTFPLPVLAEDPTEIIDAFREAMTERTRLLFFSHVLSPTGLVLPARAICAEARRRGVLTVVDGAHAPAMVPVQVDAMGCDFYGANCHKWLLAPTGAGFLVLGEGNQDRLQPLQVSWGWHPDRARFDEPDEFGSTPRLRFYEFEGTRDCSPWLAVPEAIAFQETLGFAAIRQRNECLVEYVHKLFGDKLGLAAATPRHPDLHGFLTAFRLPEHVLAPELRQGLWERFRVEAPVVERPDGMLIRVSTHFYNTEAEIDRLGEALRTLVLCHS
ncbi:MAG TPA: aminotransferase class V-fold PLP-dependent enzyme, partial [Gemmataceae bacterium]|nr:aminotransferase class V-fold PLP-dependent enzyme [Gemmataceae bacterium]